jgi:hypothetical protein
VTANLKAGNPAPQATTVSPGSIDNDEAAVDVTISGDMLRNGATFRFVYAGGGAPVGNRDDIVPSDVRWIDGTRLDGTINPFSKEGGSWDLVVTNPDGQTEVVTNAITINFFVATQLVAAYVETAADAVHLTWVLHGQEPEEFLRVYRSRAGQSRWEMIESDLRGDDYGVYTYVDRAVEPGVTYRYTLESMLGDGSTRVLHNTEATVPAAELKLKQNFPNPFNPTTTISYLLPERIRVRLTIYDVSGALVRILVDETQSGGAQTVTWDGTSRTGVRLSSGIYYYQLHAGRQSLVRQMILLK